VREDSDDVNKVGNVESPKEWGQATPFSKSLVYFDVGVVFGVSVEYVVFEGMVEGPDVLPKFWRDTGGVEANEEADLQRERLRGYHQRRRRWVAVGSDAER
jgi:hypothetical protein